jgi:hypothetical protein
MNAGQALRNPVISRRDAHGTDAPAADSWI